MLSKERKSSLRLELSGDYRRFPGIGAARFSLLLPGLAPSGRCRRLLLDWLRLFLFFFVFSRSFRFLVSLFFFLVGSSVVVLSFVGLLGIVSLLLLLAVAGAAEGDDEDERQSDDDDVDGVQPRVPVRVRQDPLEEAGVVDVQLLDLQVEGVLGPVVGDLEAVGDDL